MVHSFMSWSAVVATSRRAFAEVGAALRERLG